ncbi:hypothetical protein SAMN02746065_11388 [Desulfocicer vacuolatum DSM 3385]|uniref:EF-hand domain-containing protein n=1 Tax=Desulfocicer vacuolatum DSM 3385 TaxID=1121400 RepID=A0A1W2CSC4_9BACT|nr:hypothetical protein [Desulfocicer vacuolatum]SMC87578.1 hypothetical protein SAMN02746065_11388 [Desulfocicer vacuolatum DSM 3385]
MKITDTKVIQSGEKAFFDAVKDHLDWNAIREVVTKKMKHCSIESKDGEIVFHENSVAFKINLHCAMDVSILVDRNGNMVSGEKEPIDSSTIAASTKTIIETEKKYMAQPSSRESKMKQDMKKPDSTVSSIEEEFDANNTGVLELNDLLDELPPEQDTSSSVIKKEGWADDDGDDVDLETLFFKDKVDDEEFDEQTDERGAFWEDKK